MIETARTIIRRIEPVNELGIATAWRNLPEYIGNFTRKRVVTFLEEHYDWVEVTQRGDNSDWLAVLRKETMLIVAALKYNIEDNTVEYGIVVDPRWQRNGYASEAITALNKWMVENRPEVRMSAMRVFQNNAPAIVCYKKLGYEIVREQERRQDITPDTVLLTMIKEIKP